MDNELFKHGRIDLLCCHAMEAKLHAEHAHTLAILCACLRFCKKLPVYTVMLARRCKIPKSVST